MNRFLLAALTSAALLVPAVGALAAPGDLDTTFSGDGLERLDMGDLDFAEGVVVQPDGKIVVAGSSSDDTASDFVVARLNPDGTPDSSFSGDGKARASFGPAGAATNDFAFGVALDAKGRIVVVGKTDANARDGNPTDFAIARFLPSGSLDGTLDVDGLRTVDFGQDDSAVDVAVQPDGRIVVGGTALIAGDRDFAVARLTDLGQPDAQWDGDGRASAHFGSDERLRGIALTADGDVMGVGAQTAGIGDDVAVARWTSAGRPQLAFSGDGRRTIALGGDEAAGDVAVQPDGKSVVGVTAISGGTTRIVVLRLTAAGDFDPAFGVDGKATAPAPVSNSLAALALTGSGRVVVAGQSVTQQTLHDFEVAEFESTGKPATGFSGDGVRSIDFGDAEFADDVAVVGDRAIVVGSGFIRDFHLAAVKLDEPVAPPPPGPAPPPEPTPAPEPVPIAPAPAPEQAPAAPTQPPPAPAAPADTLAPVLSTLKLKAAGTRAEKGAFRLSETSKVVVTVQRKVGGRFKAFRTLKLTGKAGANAFKVKKLKRGSYRVTIRATDGAGNAAKPVKGKFRQR